MELCRTCQAFDIQSFAKHGPQFRGYYLDDAVRAAKGGCSFCSMLIDNLLTTSQGRNLGILQDVIRRTSDTSTSWFAEEDWPSIMRWAFHVLFPTWINISVVCGEAPTGRGEIALNVIALKAFMSFSITPVNASIRLNVAADYGEYWWRADPMPFRIAVN